MLIAIITPNTNNIPIIDVAKVKLSSIKLFAGLPNSLNKPAKIKKRNPLEIKEANKNIKIFKWSPPEAIVISLYGIGEIPAMKTIIAPF